MTQILTPEFLIVVVVAAVVAIGIRVYRARSGSGGQPPHVHDALMKRAEAQADQSPFLKKVCRDFKANGHISERQAEAVAKALARLDATKADPRRNA